MIIVLPILDLLSVDRLELEQVVLAHLERVLRVESHEGVDRLLKLFLVILDDLIDKLINRVNFVELSVADEGSSVLEFSDEIAVLVAEGDAGDLTRLLGVTALDWVLL